MKLLQGQQVGGDILANGGVRTSSRLDGPDPFRRQGAVLGQELAVFPGEDIIRDRGQIHSIPQPQAQLQHQRGLTAADRSADSHGKCALPEIAIQRPLPIMKMTGMIQMFVRMAVGTIVGVSVRVRVGMTVGGRRFGGFHGYQL